MTASTLADPAGTDALAGAAHWVAVTLTGTMAVAIATLTIAGVGFLMLTGRVPLRRGVTVIAGCFVLFGAPTIALGFLELRMRGEDPSTLAPPAVLAPPPSPPFVPAQPQVYDPYAGASVPVR